jgi:cell division protein FtsZ
MGKDVTDKLKFHLVEDGEMAKIRVIGIGGGGGNALNRMIEAGIDGVDFIAVNTDHQALNANKAPIKIQIGPQRTKGLGSGGHPETGKQAAMEDTERLLEILEGSDMVFLTAGLGGGTGTGATPIIANLATELDILCLAICTLPFEFEGRIRGRQAMEGLNDLKSAVDTVIAIPNDRLLQTVSLDTSIQDAFKLADDVLRQAVQGVSDLITKPGLINLDFADVKSIMKGMGVAFMGTGVSAGENRAVAAANKAISSPLLIDTSIDGAKGVLINITGGKDLTLHEVGKASQLIHKMAHPDANIIFGTVIDAAMKDLVKVTVIATGFDREFPREKELHQSKAAAAPAPPSLRRRTPPAVPAPGPASGPIFRETPPFPFEREERPRFDSGPADSPAGWDRAWDAFETPSFIRNKHTQLRKN